MVQFLFINNCLTLINMKTICGFIFSAILFLLLLPSCKKNENADDSENPREPVDITTSIYQKEVIDSANSFAFNLFKPVLASASENENIMISPFSISSALSMTLNGADNQTLAAMKKALGLDSRTLDEVNDTYLKLMTDMVNIDKTVMLGIANSVWIEKSLPVKAPFISCLNKWYSAEEHSFDLADPNTVLKVNSWIAQKTNGRITEMLDKLESSALMLLINAVYFNGSWKYPFDKAQTNDESFYVAPASPVSVQMMHSVLNLNVIRQDNLTIAEIPYGQGNYTMVVLLPDENLTLDETAAKISPHVWHNWMELLAGNGFKVQLDMPKFKYNYKRLLNDDLAALGMGIAFTAQADFSRISNVKLFISRVIHQTYIDTNEEGTEASAATIVEMAYGASPYPMQEINLNHPFLFFIREVTTGTIIFMGRVSDPSRE